MSIFNMAVPMHPLTPILLRLINWAQEDDPKKTYPLMGRLHYAWMTPDYKQIKLLLKDGPKSWSEQKQEILDQINSHESFVSVETLTRDKVYLVATFGILKESCGDAIPDNIAELIKTMDETNNLTKDPFDIFDETMKKMQDGTWEPPKEAIDLMRKIESSINDDEQGIKIIET